MEQMRNFDATTIGRQRFESVGCGFMRHHDGRIFFLTTWGNETIPFPVLADGTLDQKVDMKLIQDVFSTKVTLVHWKDLGITNLGEWAMANHVASAAAVAAAAVAAAKLSA